MDYTRKFMLIISMGLCLTSVMGAMEEAVRPEQDEKSNAQDILEARARVFLYPNTYRCTHKGFLGYRWLWGSRLSSFWKSSHAEKFMCANENPGEVSVSTTLKTAPKVFGYYSKQVMKIPLKGVASHVAVKEGPSREEQARTLQLMKIIEKTKYDSSSSNFCNYSIGGLVTIIGSMVAKLGMDYACNKYNASSPVLANVGLLTCALGGMAAIWYAYTHFYLKLAPNSSKMLKTLKNADMLPEVLLGTNCREREFKMADSDQYVVIEDKSVNDRLCDYMHRRIDGKRFCLSCLRDGDHDNFNVAEDKFFWNGGGKYWHQALRNDPNTFVVINADANHRLEDHVPYKRKPNLTININNVTPKK